MERALERDLATPPVTGEVGELVDWLRRLSDEMIAEGREAVSYHADQSAAMLERCAAALVLTKQRLDDVVDIIRRPVLGKQPYDAAGILSGTARRIARVLEGGDFYEDIFAQPKATLPNTEQPT